MTKRSNGAGFKIPAFGEVFAFFKGHSAIELAQPYYDKCQNNGWTAAAPPTALTGWRSERKPMRNWKLSARKYINHNRLVKKRRTN